MKKFYALKNKDACNEYLSALVSAGYEETTKMDNADFALIDCEHKGGLAERIGYFSETRPLFVYPHTPFSYYLWDGRYTPANIACNFVVGQGAIMSMKAYGYPYRVEAVGFTGCEINPFTPTTGTRLIFAPPHLRGNGKYALRMVYESVRQVASIIVKNIDRFESVTVACSYQGIEESGLSEFIGTKAEFEYVNTYEIPKPRQNVIRQIAEKDIIIASNTFAYLSVAHGKPAVMFYAMDSVDKIVNNFNLYKSYYRFPLMLEEMTIDELLDARTTENERVKEWKRLNIGLPFDADKFLSIVREYV